MDMSAVSLFATIFGLIFVAELPDKTAFASIILAARLPPRPVLAGACVAFLLHAGLAVLFGSLLGLLPARWVHIGAGVLFMVFAVLMVLRKEEAEEEVQPGNKTAFLTAFTMIFLAEWGDLTQLAIATMAARYHAPLLVFAASTLALWSVSAIGVALGSRLKNAINPVLFARIAAVAFAAVGAWMLYGALS